MGELQPMSQFQLAMSGHGSATLLHDFEGTGREDTNPLLVEIADKLDQLLEKETRIDRSDLAEIGRAAATVSRMKGRGG